MQKITTNYAVGSQCPGLKKTQKCSWFSFNHEFLHRGLLLARCYWTTCF